MKPTKQEKIQFTLRLPEELNKIIIKLSEETGISKNSIIATSLWNYLTSKKI